MVGVVCCAIGLVSKITADTSKVIRNLDANIVIIFEYNGVV